MPLSACGAPGELVTRTGSDQGRPMHQRFFDALPRRRYRLHIPGQRSGATCTAPFSNRRAARPGRKQARTFGRASIRPGSDRGGSAARVARQVERQRHKLELRALATSPAARRAHAGATMPRCKRINAETLSISKASIGAALAKMGDGGPAILTGTRGVRDVGSHREHRASAGGTRQRFGIGLCHSPEPPSPLRRATPFRRTPGP